MLLYAVTSRDWLGAFTLAQCVKKALDGGVTFVQLREKNLDFDSFLAEAIKIGKLCNDYHVPFVINDNIEIAKLSNADGVHIGQDDGDVAIAKAYLGADKIVGVTAHNLDEAMQAQLGGADYIGVGAVFGSTTKHNTVQLDMTMCRQITKNIFIPVVGIGGINEQNISLLGGYGLDGVAVVSGIFAQNDITNACKNLKKLSLQMVKNNEI